MHILCSISGIEFSCEHFPGFLSSGEYHHPVFSLPQKKLLSYLGKWAGSELTPTDSYLLFLSLLNSSDLVEFRVPVARTNFTDSIVAQNLEALAKTVLKLNTVTNPAVIFPRYVISQDTKTLSNIQYWIQNWNESYEEFRSGKSREYENHKLQQRESALERLIKNPHRPISSYSNQLSDWAAVAGSFPIFNLTSPLSGLTSSCSDYWKLLIQNCAKEEKIFSINRSDLEELLEHCEEHIPVGSIYSHALFSVLRHALEKQKNFLGLGDLDIGKKISYTILTEDISTEAANLKAMIDSAPLEIPRLEQYPTRFAYMKAKLRYDLSKKYGDSV